MANHYELLTARPGKEGKVWWSRIGSMFPAKDGNGYSIILDAYPLPDKEGRVSCIAREPKPREQPAQSGGYAGNLSHQLDDEVPFFMEWR